LASGAGIFLLTGVSDKPILPSYGIFGFMVTLGLLIFEIHGIRKCTHFIVLGKFLEEKNHINGQFTHLCEGLRPLGSSQYSFARFINEPLAAGVIYPAVLGGWTFLALSSPCLPFHALASLTGIAVFFIGFYAMLKFNIWLVDTDSKKKMYELNHPEAPITKTED
jgi:hypothetical protein